MKILKDRAGHWAECLLMKDHKGIKMHFWKPINYKFDFCFLCLFRIRKDNGTLRVSTHKGIELKELRTPERDTL